MGVDWALVFLRRDTEFDCVSLREMTEVKGLEAGLWRLFHEPRSVTSDVQAKMGVAHWPILCAPRGF